MIIGAARRVSPTRAPAQTLALGLALPLGLLLGLLLAACSDGGATPPTTSLPTTLPASATPGQSPHPSATTSATPTTASRTLSPPVLPAAARKPTRDGAVAFFTYFWATYNYGLANLDSASLKLISEARCGYCSNAIQTLDSAKRAGYRVEGGDVTVVLAVAAPGKPDQGLIVNGKVAQATQRTLSASGSVVGSFSANSNQRVDAAMRWSDGRWRMVELRVLVPEGAS